MSRWRDTATTAKGKHWKSMKPKCTHLDQIKFTEPASHVCQECLDMGDRWVHLRMCLVCGHVACCDSSKNKHATKHFHTTSHPLERIQGSCTL
jgi:uncharacterized UBP type Zn finger protein